MVSPTNSVASHPALAELADIHLPEAINYWPPAPGWWILAGLLILFVYISYRLIRSFLQIRHYRTALLEELQLVQRHWKKQQNIVLTAAKISSLLRRYCIDQNQRDKVAATSQQEWSHYLDIHLKPLEFSKKYQELIIELPYQDPLIKFDLEENNIYSKKINELLLKLKIIFKKSKRPKRMINV